MIDSHADEAGTPLLGRLEVLTLVGVIGALALILGLAAAVMAGSSTATKKVPYTQSGTFAYSASAPASSVYAPKGLTTGQPILSDVVGSVGTNFAYQFTSQAVAQVHGTASMVAIVKLDQGFHRDFPVAPSKPFTGDKITVGGTLPVHDIVAYVTATLASLGNTSGSSSATVTLSPKIAVSGSVGGHLLSTTYGPSLPFTLNGNTLTVSQGQSVPDAGAHPTDVFKPSEPGAVQYKVSEPATVNLLFAHPSTSVAMAVGFVVALLCLSLGFWIGRPLLSDDEENESERIRALYASQLLPIRSLRVPEGPVAEVASISALADLAKQYETKIMHLRGEEGDSYLLWDDGMLYRYGDGAEVDTLPATSVSQPAEPTKVQSEPPAPALVEAEDVTPAPEPEEREVEATTDESSPTERTFAAAPRADSSEDQHTGPDAESDTPTGNVTVVESSADEVEEPDDETGSEPVATLYYSRPSPYRFGPSVNLSAEQPAETNGSAAALDNAPLAEEEPAEQQETVPVTPVVSNDRSLAGSRNYRYSWETDTEPAE